jgi:hypothetical protein
MVRAFEESGVGPGVWPRILRRGIWPWSPEIYRRYIDLKVGWRRIRPAGRSATRGQIAVVNLKVEDYYPSEKRFLLRSKEKGGKEKELPVHHSYWQPV